MKSAKYQVPWKLCPAPGCFRFLTENSKGEKSTMCLIHWRRSPRHLRQMLKRAQREGNQERIDYIMWKMMRYWKSLPPTQTLPRKAGTNDRSQVVSAANC